MAAQRAALDSRFRGNDEGEGMLVPRSGAPFDRLRANGD